MTILGYAERHPLTTAYMVHRFVMHKYHPDLVAAKRARKAQNGGGGLVLMHLVFVGIPVGATFLLYVLVCLTWYGQRYWTHKLLRRSTPGPNLVVPGYFPKKVGPVAPTAAEVRAAQWQAHMDGLARHEAASQARLAAVMASLGNPPSQDEPPAS